MCKTCVTQGTRIFQMTDVGGEKSSWIKDLFQARETPVGFYTPESKKRTDLVPDRTVPLTCENPLLVTSWCRVTNELTII